MTNGELIDVLQKYPRDMELFYRRYTVDQKPDDPRLVIDPLRYKVIAPDPNHRPDGITEITLTQKKIALIRTFDYPIVRDYNWHARLSSQGRWYAHTQLRSGYEGNGLVRHVGRDMHQLLMPEARLVDHRDGNGLNNARENLREASKSLNAFNQIPKGDMHGIYKSSRLGREDRWIASLRMTRPDGRRSGYLGYFKSKEEAISARKQAESELPPEYTREALPITKW